jgi:aspartyl-tRNA synthetase
MDSRGFVEIHSPKLIAGESESGAGVFTTDYFGETACLAQSPQLYKQLAVAGDLGGVYEVGPVFRAENSNTRRHLCEFTGLDFEVPIVSHYSEAISIGHGVFKAIFEGLEAECSDLLTSVRAQFPSSKPVISDEPVVLHFDDALQLLRDAGLAPEGGDDLSGADELRLGELVKEKHGVDFFVVDRYPSSIRPFYTMLDPSDSTRSNSYDFFLRGQEICSGAQRVHDPSLLRDQLRARAASLSLSDAIDARVRVRAPTHASRRRREGFGPRRRGPLGLAEELHAGLRARRAAARGLRLRAGARRLPLFGARQH